MRRRSFLLIAGGTSLFSPRLSGLRQLLDRPQDQSSDRFSGALCRGGLVRTESASVPSSGTALPGSDIPKYTESLPTFAGSRVSADNIVVSIEEFQQLVQPASLYSELPMPFSQGTFVWGYRVGDAPRVIPVLRSRPCEARRPPSPTSIICRCRPGCSTS